MTLQELKLKFLIDLDQIYPKEEILSFFFLLIHHKMGLTRTEIALNQNQIIPKEDLNFYLDALTELQDEKPIQYIIGETEFYGLTFKVNDEVLIPRPETEELVDWILKEFNEKKEPNILDIGTGSGCIAISLSKHLPEANIFGMDISKQALQTAIQNTKLNKVKINLFQQDILKNNDTLNYPTSLRTGHVMNSLPMEFDIIVSNPPYVRELEKLEIKSNVLQNEPHIALFVSDENPLLFYDKIADFAKQYLTANGLLFLEINQYLAKNTTILLRQKGFKTIELRKDVFGNDRMIKTSLF
ncbi:MAG: peptide chain release factor N(5)-glutamine methyltransferase [Aureibaculum sp.]|nr:peptide chain release factor N(5)-glutamine methyltransferase [Aureibaculum sp.]